MDRTPDTVIPPPSLRDHPAIARTWSDLAVETTSARGMLGAAEMNPRLIAAAAAEPEAPTAPLFRSWCADNLSHDGRHGEAIVAYAAAAESAETAAAIHERVDIAGAALHHLAASARQIGQIDTALSALDDLTARIPDSGEPRLEAGLLAERAGRRDDARRRFDEASSGLGRSDPGSADRARREALRMEAPGDHRFPTAEAAVDALRIALGSGDQGPTLAGLLSPTHFTVGLMGGEPGFEDDDIRDRVLAEISSGSPTIHGRVRGIGETRHLLTDGWDGALLRGPVALEITRATTGWEWTGIVLSSPTDEWLDRWTPDTVQRNQPLPFFLKAPWPAGLHMMAGGALEFAAHLAIIKASFPFGVAVAYELSRGSCGFGPRGFYYHTRPTHSGEANGFAIDFTRYERGEPFHNASGDTPALAARGGLVVTACGGRDSGDRSSSNKVEILHEDPATGDEYLTRYVHLAGPDALDVMTGAPAFVGQRLGLIDSSGTYFDHLHFSVHDQSSVVAGESVSCTGVRRGPRVRPSPLDGVELTDGDSGTCIRSTNREFRPPPPDDAAFVRQRVPTRMAPRQSVPVSITMHNTGPTTWPPGYKLAAIHQGWSRDEVPVGRPVGPDEEVTVEFEVTTLTEGDFPFQWRMSRLFTGMFGEATPILDIEVAAETDGDPCSTIRDAVHSAENRASQLQAQLQTASPSQKAAIVAMIRRVGAEIAALEARAARLGCD